MKPKHTPGPWHFVNKHGGIRIHAPWKAVNDHGGTPIAQLVADDRDGVHAESNAHLIAAAPELLEALELSLQSFIGPSEFDEDTSPLVEIMKKAIAKARGEGC